MYDQVASNKRRSVVPRRCFRRARLSSWRGPSISLLGYGVAGLVIALVIARRRFVRRVLEVRRRRAGDEPRQAGRPDAVRPPAQPRRGSLHRRRAAEAARVRHRRRSAERVRHRPQPAARGHRGDDGAARQDEPRRARRRAGPRAEPRQELRHPRVDAGRHAGRHHRAAVGLGPALHLLGRRPSPRQRRARRPQPIFAAARLRAADLHADRRPAHAIRHQPAPGSAGRCFGRGADAVSPRSHLRAGEAEGGPDRRALWFARHGASLDRGAGRPHVPKKALAWLGRLFNTHPPLDERIEALREL